MPRFTQDDLWEEHGEIGTTAGGPPKSMGDGPLFEADHRKNVIEWVNQMPEIVAMRERAANKLNNNQFK